MKKNKHRRHSAAFKSKVALEAIKGVKTAREIASEYELHPVQVNDWKRQAMERMSDLFESPKSKETKTAGIAPKQYQAKIGQLAMEVDYLRKKCVQWGLNDDEPWSTSLTQD